MTVLEVSHDGFVGSFATHVLASTPTNTPTPVVGTRTYLGDYIKLQSVGEDFYGVFSAGNEPVKANFPSGVVYQRNVDWATQTLLRNDGVTPVRLYRSLLLQAEVRNSEGHHRHRRSRCVRRMLRRFTQG